MWLMLQQDQPEDYVIATGLKQMLIDLIDYWRSQGAVDLLPREALEVFIKAAKPELRIRVTLCTFT